MNTAEQIDLDFDQVFDQAFDQATGAVEPEAEAASEITAEPEAEATEVEGQAPEQGGEAAPETEPEPEPEPLPAAVTAPAIDPRELAAAMVEAQEIRQKARQQPPAEAPSAPKAAEYTDFLDDREKAALENFKSEWSEVASPVNALVRAHVQAALTNQEQKFLALMQERLAPVESVAAQSQEATHYATIQAAHPDFREVAAAMPEWIEKQPSFVRDAYKNVYQKGSTAEVVELLSTYKQAMSSTGAVPAQPASSAAQVKPKAPPVNKAALAATLAPPAAQRSTMTTSRDPSDFDSAFEEAINR
jgi:hypothetical protein